jgi:hypothetical protein
MGNGEQGTGNGEWGMGNADILKTKERDNESKSFALSLC